MNLEKHHDIGRFTASGISRYQLDCVHLNAETGHVEATDGRVAIRVPAEIPERKLIDPKSLKAAISLDHLPAMKEVEPRHGDKIRFPKMNDVIPEKHKTTVRLDAESLLKIAQFANGLPKNDEVACVEFRIPQRKDMIWGYRIYVDSEQRAEGAIMPLKEVK